MTAPRLSRKPDDVLRRIGAGGTRATVRRILATWDQRTDQHMTDGAAWYGGSADAILTALVDAGAPSREHAAAVIAHLSPRTTWARNVNGAAALVVGGELAARRAGCITRNVTSAARALASSDPLGTLTGPKTSAFARNLLGDRTAVTVDVWAARIALGGAVSDPERMLTLTGVYDAVAHAYRLAARHAGVDPTTLQATTWITARNGRAA